MDAGFNVVVAAGSLKSADERAVRFAHRWTSEGVTVETDFTGGHLFHLAAAGCVLNDIYREARGLGIELDGVRVAAHGGFNDDTWESIGISYSVDVIFPASAEAVGHLLDVVDAVAEIPRAIRRGASVRRIP